MEKSSIIKKLIKEGLITQQTRIQISPYYGYNPDNIDKICKSSGLTEEEFNELWESQPFSEEFFGFFTFENHFDDLTLMYNSGKLYDMSNKDTREKVRNALNQMVDLD